MTRWTGTPAYLQIAAEFRTRILDGSMPADAKLPSESELMRTHGVSRIVAKMAVGVLRNEGLIVSHQGKGSYVKAIRRVVRDSAGRYSRRRAVSTSPFRSDARRSGQQGRWEHDSIELRASADTAYRLALDMDTPVMRTEYRYFVENEPIQLSTSWEPLDLTRDTPIVYPEDGPTVGVIARMDRIGQRIDNVVEKVTARAARPGETSRLELPRTGGYVLVIERTHYVADRPVETCDIVFPGDRYQLTYRIPVD